MTAQPPLETCKSNGKTMESCLCELGRQVCDVLGDSGELPLAGLARKVPVATTNEVAMAVGWLAREGRLHFRRSGGVWEIRLQESSRQ